MNYLTKLIFIPLAILSVASAKADIIIVNGDSYNEGLNDRTVVTSVGGNPGTTVGEQRLKVFEKAAEILNASLDVTAPVKVQAAFNSMSCNSREGELGYAGPEGIEYSLEGQSAIPHALYNQLVGEDVDPDTSEIYARFNSSIDNNDNCLSDTNWYYGFDAPEGYDISLLTVVLHEITHGLGFLSFFPQDGGFGALWNDGFNNLTELYDPFSRNLLNAETGEYLIDQAKNDRYLSLRNTSNLVWDGSYVNSKATNLTEGVNNDHVQIYAPASYERGSSTSHFDTALSPNELMEPTYAEFEDNAGLALEALFDIGWQPNPDNLPNYAPVLDAIGALALDEDSSLAVDLSGSDLNGDPLVYSLANVDSNIGAVLDGTSLTLTPISNFNGEGTITVQVSDGESVDNEIVIVTVNPVNDAPIINPISNTEFNIATTPEIDLTLSLIHI